MKYVKHTSLTIVFLLITEFWSCTRYAVITEQKFASQTANVGPNVFLTTFSYENSSYPPILLVDPVFINKKALYLGDKSGLIGVLNGNGFSVWLLHFEDHKSVNLKEVGENLIPETVARIQKISGRKEYVLGGVSLGGQAILHSFKAKKVPDTAKTFFLGTGMDYKYNDSFLEQMKSEKRFGTDVNVSCKNKDSFCKRFISLDEDDPKTLFVYQNLLNYLPTIEENPKTWESFEATGFPSLFIGGRIDNVAPTESIHPVYRRKKGDKEFWEAGRDNGMSIDYDHLGLFAYEDAPSELYQKIADWLKRSVSETKKTSSNPASP
ncbi:alpha/beta hydrolase [Leptospira gomenensis]|uniref:Alpha/beta hydrolase n=1 Tax=Leptospira gomenensis TaxID=2484974 RepID=A0A5F1YEM1_9LEPT|nr:alpha/beta hydrolase [Leptospira gomenensis]TGK36018.1 alpha/beta hydrolase [Leptospira gomenensis]TGK44450.1 alpha/beta hydrolase [Leptospira gomenensis]TGK53378.1 alpha/beta hydrolase [Leptospira gomenensis]TGK60687.1 alpha/beta hydrolase [Leptospira gomenensis]